MKKFILISLMLITMIITAQTAVAPASGDGTSGNPYQIATLENLYWIASDTANWNKYYIQTADIDASSTSAWNSGAGWVPIGNETVKFTGSYNGNRHTITGIYINRPTEANLGLFGYVYGGTINYLGLKNVNISGYRRIGALAGWISSSNPVNYCFSTGVVTSSYEYSYTGGLFGYSYNTDILNCYSMANVNGRQSIGGFIGATQDSDITNSFSTGLVTSYNPIYEGGFIGTWGGNASYPGLTANFWDIESSGTTTGITNQTFDGVTGKTTAEMQTDTTFTNTGWNFSTVWGIDSLYNDGYPFLLWERMSLPILTTQNVTGISTTYATGNGTIVDIGFPYPTQHGFCWNTTGMPTLADSFTQEGAADSAGTFTSQLLMLESNTLYFIRAYATNTLGTAYGDEMSFSTLAIVASEPSGSGTEIDPYLISNIEELYWITQSDSRWDKYYLQTADIDASVTEFIEYGGGWPGIGNYYPGFSGYYNGQNYTIAGLTINAPSSQYKGLFGQTNGGSITNVSLTGVNISGSGYTGSLIGYNGTTFIQNCTGAGDVTGDGMTGGLVGGISGNSSLLVENCSFDGTVTGTSYTGGLIGDIQNFCQIENCRSNAVVTATSSYTGGFIGRAYTYSTVKNSYSEGSVHGIYTTGGFAGMLDQYAEIYNCYSASQVTSDQDYSEETAGFAGQSYYSYIYDSYATGSVTGYWIAGGFIGRNSGASKVYNCYSTGAVTGDSELGGFIGLVYNGGSAIVSNCFWDTEISGLSTSQGGTGVTGKTTAEMKTLATFTDAGWDFVDETANGTDDDWNIDGYNNGGYPFLSWQDILPVPLSAPQNVIVAYSSDPELTWDAVSGASSYSVYSSEDPYTEFPAGWTLETSGETGTGWTDTGAAETKKFYIVVAVN